MNKLKQMLKDNLWIILLDIVAVNLSYFLALILRFYVNNEFRSSVTFYLSYYVRFTPVYTVLSLVVFALFKLYVGIWKYAGINDLNRIAMANLCTLALHVAGTVIVIHLDPQHSVSRMPFSYYLIGALLQLLFMVGIRFGWRLLQMERVRIRNRGRDAAILPTLIIGAGSTCHRILRNMDEDAAFQAVAVLDPDRAGKTFDGLPVVGGTLEEALSRFKPRAVFIADSTLTRQERDHIREICAQQELAVYDYTGFLANLGGRIPLAALLEVAKGPVTVRVGEEERTYASAIQAMVEITEQYDVVSVTDLKLELRKSTQLAYEGYEAWAQQYREETGQEPSFF